MSKDNLEKLAKAAHEYAALRTADDGMPTTIAFIEADNRTIFMTCEEWVSDKENVADVMRRVFKSQGVTDYLVVSEAWMSWQPVNSEPMMPRDDPKRIEVMTFGGTDLEGNNSLWIARIERREAGAVLGPLEKQEEGELGGFAMTLLGHGRAH